LVATRNAARTVAALCKHWSHRFETEFDGGHGRVNFEVAAAHFDVRADGLTATLAASDAATLAKLQPVVADHLRRFARAETLAIEWAPAAADWA
jgi:hypothetical protein